MSVAYKNIARVIKPHGMKGEVVVLALHGLPDIIEEGMRVALTPPALNRERFSIVESVTSGEKGDLVLFSCAHNLDEAEALVGCYVLVAEDDIELGEYEVAVDDLLGREVEDDEHGLLGAITEVIITPANDAWTINGPFGEFLIPVIEDVVTEIPDEGSIHVTLLPGLLD